MQGLAYLHKSKFHSHGNISSLTCHVDNRWALKLDCIVLPLFRNTSQNPAALATDIARSQRNNQSAMEEQRDVFRDMLWTAPELLRDKKSPVFGTQKGDMYSFGIVMQEIAYRAAPFFIEDRTAKGNKIYYCVKSLTAF